MIKLYDSKKICYMSIILNIVFDIIFTINSFFSRYIGLIPLSDGIRFINLHDDGSWQTFATIFIYLFQVITGRAIDAYYSTMLLIYTAYLITFIIMIVIANRSKNKTAKKVAKKLVIIDTVCMTLAVMIFWLMRYIFNN